MFSVSLVIALKACEQSRFHSLGDNNAVIRLFYHFTRGNLSEDRGEGN